MTESVLAQYGGICGECGGGIRPGDRIIMVDGGWRHSSCRSATFCPVCFTQRSVSGACFCDAEAA